MNFLLQLGQTLGLAGVGVGVFFLLFKKIIEKNVFPRLDQERGYRLLRTIVYVIFGFSCIVLVITSLTQIIANGRISFSISAKGVEIDAMSKETYQLILLGRSASAAEPDRALLGRLTMDIDASYDQFGSVSTRLVSQLSQLSQYIQPDLLNRAQAEISLGRSDALLQVAHSLVDRARGGGAGPSPQTAADFAVLLGKYNELLGSFTNAETCYRLAFDVYPAGASGGIALAELLLERGQPREVSEIAERLVGILQPDQNSLQLAEALALRAEIRMWLGKFDVALADVHAAEDILEGQQKGSVAARKQLANVLNLSGGLSAQTGDLNTGEQKLRTAVELLNDSAQRHEAVNCSTNLFKILIDMGKLRAADQVRNKIQPDVEQLAPRDFFRGFYALSTAYFFLRSQNLDAAETNLDYAADFFDPAKLNTDEPLRLARIRCFQARLQFLKQKPDESIASGVACLRLLSEVSPGRIEDYIEGYYVLVKAALMKRDPGAALEYTKKLVMDSSVAKNMVERAKLTQSVAEASILIAKGNADQAQEILADASRRLALLERQSGMLIDAASDAFLLRTGVLAPGGTTVSLDQINSARAQYGARLIE